MKNLVGRFKTVITSKASMWALLLIVFSATAELHVRPVEAQQDRKGSEGGPRRLKTVFGVVEVDVPGCFPFLEAESHLWEIQVGGFKHQNTAQVHRTKIEEFISWYREIGHLELQTSGQACLIATAKNKGQVETLKKQSYIADVQLRNFEFFVQGITKQCQLGELWLDENDPPLANQ